jgi:hypothetical protein
MKLEARLRAFAAFARQRSFSAAATELHISQPAISKHIAELEHALGLKLVERARRDGALTTAGDFVAVRSIASRPKPSRVIVVRQVAVDHVVWRARTGQPAGQGALRRAVAVSQRSGDSGGDRGDPYTRFSRRAARGKPLISFAMWRSKPNHWRAITRPDACVPVRIRAVE